MVSKCPSKEELTQRSPDAASTLPFTPPRTEAKDDTGLRLKLNTDTTSLYLDPASPTDSEFPSLFSPAGSDDSRITAASSAPSNDFSDTPKSNALCLTPSQRRSDRNLRKKPALNSPRLSLERLTSPDRFLPARNLSSSPSIPFRLGKDPGLLSTHEKLQRKRDSSLDPFDLPGVRSGSPRRRASIDGRITPRHRPRYINDQLLNDQFLTLRHATPSLRAQPGAVWRIGGGSNTPRGPQFAVSDGNGGLLGSGTVAPLHVANFISKQSSSLHRQAHESRLALALNVDQASRVFNNNGTSVDSQPTRPNTAHLPELRSDIWGNYTDSPSTYDISAPNINLKNATHFFSALVPPRKTRITFEVSWPSTNSNMIPTDSNKRIEPPNRSVPSTPFRVLDAPLLRDDFYCSTLAYCYTANVLAVGLGHRVYLWSERTSVQYPPLKDHSPANYVMSLCFSSHQGGRSILAVGRHDGQITLWSTFDKEPRFEVKLPNPVSCVSFKNVTTRRTSDRFSPSLVEMEDLVVGDDLGYVWYYSVEWMDRKSRKNHRWDGSMNLLAKINAHTQQICGLAWSPDGKHLATGGNDNSCLLFDMASLIQEDASKDNEAPSEQNSHIPKRFSRSEDDSRVPSHQHLNRIKGWYHRGSRHRSQCKSSDDGLLAEPENFAKRQKIPSTSLTVIVPLGREKHRFAHAAAVKAIAFAPWQPSLLATGGGTNDRCIRFFHANSGACLATIDVHAQVTSLIWSKTRREIVATFGYAQPEHPFRIAVFAWPSCQQVVAISWASNSDRGRYGNTVPPDCGRALWAISYPGGPNEATYESFDSAPATAGAGLASSRRNQSVSTDTNQRLSHSEGSTWWSRTAEEGCIIVASSDECVKFHEVWSGTPKTVVGITGQLGGSPILESSEGIEDDGNETIR